MKQKPEKGNPGNQEEIEEGEAIHQAQKNRDEWRVTSDE